MFILGRTGLTYARLAFSAGPGGHQLLPVAVHWSDLPQCLSQAGAFDARINEWRQEYTANVHKVPQVLLGVPPAHTLVTETRPWWETEPWSEELDGVTYEPTFQGDLHEQSCSPYAQPRSSPA